MKLAILVASLAGASAFVAPAANSGAVATRRFAKDEKPEMMGGAAISALTKDVKTIYKTEDIDKFLPHRYPFAFIDKIVEIEPGKKAVGIKQVTKNEEFFNGHFPSMPVMPGVLQLEAMAQLAGCIMAGLEGAEPGAIFFFGGADGVKWKVNLEESFSSLRDPPPTP
jgi:3-hydroxyacyl-[acyl-carrier-protein] dehydratase